jgi:MoaA/NifB/PqqE/SkfB family radical SAM enzyme
MLGKAPTLHLEITSRCALKCPSCPRTEFRNSLKVSELSLDMIEQAVMSGPIYKELFLCGDHGDPIYHSQFHQVLHLLKQAPQSPPISIATNGSHRPKEWWAETGKILRSKDYVTFGIDGLQLTSSKYRVGSQWKSIDEAILSLREHSACQIVWQWILFKFNENQLELAAHQARQWNIDYFMLIYSSRYGDNDPIKPSINLEQANEIFLNAYNLS